MQELLDNPAFQAGIGPLLAGLVIALALGRTRFAWLAIVAAFLLMLALSTGISFSPLTASRKMQLLVLIAAGLGLALDLSKNHARAVPTALSLVAAVAAAWAVSSVLLQRELAQALLWGGLVFVCTGACLSLMLGLRDDGPATGAAGVGLGLAAGVSALLSASAGFFMAGISIAAASGAMLVAQILLGRPMPAGFTGALTIGLSTVLFATGAGLLAQLPWYALPLLLAVPAALKLLPLTAWPVRTRAVALGAIASVVAALPVLAAWLSSRGA